MGKRILYLVAGLVFLGSLSGCAFDPKVQAAYKGAIQAGAKAYDDVLATQLWWICNAASIGAVRRKFGNSNEMTNAYRTLCAENLTADLISNYKAGKLPSTLPPPDLPVSATVPTPSN